jgi:F-box/WD-40 domain protein MET30
VLEGHDSAVTCVYFDNEKLISGSMDGSLRLWDMKTGKCRAKAEADM